MNDIPSSGQDDGDRDRGSDETKTIKIEMTQGRAREDGRLGAM